MPPPPAGASGSEEDPIGHAFAENKRIAREVRVSCSLLMVPTADLPTAVLERTTSVAAELDLNFVFLLQEDLKNNFNYEGLGLVWNVAVNDLPLSENWDQALRTFPQLKPGRPCCPRSL